MQVAGQGRVLACLYKASSDTVEMLFSDIIDKKKIKS